MVAGVLLRCNRVIDVLLYSCYGVLGGCWDVARIFLVSYVLLYDC